MGAGEPSEREARTPEDIDDCVEVLRHFWREHPNWRLGQVVSNAARMSGWQSRDVFMIEDSKIWYGLGLILGKEMKYRKDRNEAAVAQTRELEGE